ncbi:MAG: molybdenum cofactor synthesis domain-containing protein [Myxococcota bacterium]
MKSPRVPRTRHTARATARVDMPEDVWEALRGDSELLAETRVTGILAARRASESLPRTGAVELDTVEVSFDWDDTSLVVEASVAGFSRQQIGSRALTCVLNCVTAVVDAFPRRAEAISITEARVTKSRGGTTLSYDFDPPVRAAVLTVSDSVAGGHKDDRAGQVVKSAVEGLADHGVELDTYRIVGDDAEAIEQAVSSWCADGVELVLTVGGTGLVHTDKTVDAVEPLLDTHVPGLVEALRDYGLEQTPLAFMSRGIAGLVGDALVVTLPGSTGGAREATEALFPAVLHVFHALRTSREHLLGDSP